MLDGSDSLLLTAETAVGQYPVEAIAVMHRIILEAEKSGRVRRGPVPEPPMVIPDATCLAAVRAAYDVGARYVASFTMSGSTTVAVSRFKPRTPILAFTPRPEVQRRMTMLWGVEPWLTPELVGTSDLMTYLDRTLLRKGMALKGDVVAVVSGFPVGVPGSTNLMTLHTVGNDEALKKGAAARKKKV